MPTLAELDRDTKKHEWEKEWKYNFKPTPLLGFGGSKKKKKKKNTNLDDTAEILALNREYRAKNRADDRVRRQVYNDTMDVLNDCFANTSQVHIPHLEKETDSVEARMGRVKKNIRDYSISELEQVQAEMRRFAERRYEQHGIVLDMNQLVARWNAYAERMYAFDASLQHCKEDIKFCEQALDQVVDGAKKGATTRDQLNHAAQEIDTRLDRCLYPQLKFVEAMAKVLVVKKRLFALSQQCNGMPDAEAEEFARLSRTLATMAQAAQSHEHVAEEAEVAQLQADFTSLERKLSRTPNPSVITAPPPEQTDNMKQQQPIQTNNTAQTTQPNSTKQWKPFKASNTAQTTQHNNTVQWKSDKTNNTVQRKRFLDDNVWGDYEGQLDAQGKRHGKGMIVWENGYRYQGDFVDDVREGQGFRMGINMWEAFMTIVGMAEPCFGTKTVLWRWDDMTWAKILVKASVGAPTVNRPCVSWMENPRDT